MFFDYPKSIIIRHNRENLKKCTLSAIEDRSDCLFFLYPFCAQDPIICSTQSYILLDFEGPVLSAEDAASGIILLDGTWRYAQKMMLHLPQLHDVPRRSLPPELRTAYPRRQQDCPMPQRGLASIEALHAAYSLLGRDTTGLLDQYHWKQDFINYNKSFVIDFK